MARRRKNNFEEWVEVASRLPWWLALILAVVAYLLLHRVAMAPIEPVAYKSGQISAVILPTLWRTIAAFGQYLVPAVLVIGAIGSLVARSQRRQLVSTVAHAKSADALNDMSWQEFEVLVGEGFRLQGYAVEETGRAGPDGGIDLVLRRGGEKFFVQCKQWRAYKVGSEVVQQLYGVMAAHGAAGGFVVTSGRFTEDAKAFAQGRNVRLMDGEQLAALMRSVQRHRTAEGLNPQRQPTPASRAPSASAFAPRPMAPQARGEPSIPDASDASPWCPVCGKAMVKRTARRGTTAGQSFWGCSGYPACKGTRPG